MVCMEVVMKAFDVIVVGAGSAGCVVASRLSQESQSGGAVLLLEVGQRDNDPLIHIPAGYAKILEHALHLWPYTTTPQTQLDGLARRTRTGQGAWRGQLDQRHGLCSWPSPGLCQLAERRR